MTEERAAIYAVLPIIHNALFGDLNKKVALEWIQDILNKTLEIKEVE